MKLIEIKGKYGVDIGNYVQVDDEDYTWLCKYIWSWSKNQRGKVYARRSYTENGRKIRISMHREIMQVTNPKILIDHKDGNGLNNQRENLRIATASQNIANAKKPNTNSISQYKGVTRWIKKMKQGTYTGWAACCYKDKKAYKKHCKTEMEAALKYNELALKLHGEFAKINIL